MGSLKIIERKANWIMDHGTQQHHGNGQHDKRCKWALAGFIAVAAFFLWAEHRAHILGALPYLLVLACPLMHIFHHAGHWHQGHGGAAGPDGKKRPTEGQS